MIANRKIPKCGSMTVNLVVLLISTSAFAQVFGNLQFKTTLQINYEAEINPHLISRADARYYGILNLSTLFPQQNLTGIFSIKNLTSDTLKLAFDGQSLLKYLQLRYTYHHDSIRTQHIIPLHLTESIAFHNNERLPSYGKGYYLPPNCSVGVYTDCLWDELGKLEPQIVDFQYVYNNSADASVDSNLTLAIFRSRIDTFEIKKTLDNRLDSIYYYTFQAKNQYDQGSYQNTIDYCLQILQLDSANFAAIRKLTDVLWRLNRFEDAERYAQKGISLLMNPPPPNSLTVTLGNERYLLSTMQKRLELIRHHEEWRSVDYPTQ